MDETQIIKKNFEFLETNIEHRDGIVPLIFGYEKTTKKKSEIKYNKHIYVLHYVVSGSGFLNNIPIKKNQVFLLSPGSDDIYRPDPNDPWTYIWVELVGPSITTYINYCGFNEDIKILDVKESEEIMNQFSIIFNEVPKLVNKHSKEIMYVSSTMNIFSSIIEKNGYLEKNKEKSNQEIVIDNIISFINSNYSDPNLNVEYLANHFSYASSYLTRLFKKYTNLSPIKYITKIRMEYATQLFEKKHTNINQVASIVGYQNQFYFSKIFLKYYGIRPSEYLSKIQDK